MLHGSQSPSPTVPAEPQLHTLPHTAPHTVPDFQLCTQFPQLPHTLARTPRVPPSPHRVTCLRPPTRPTLPHSASAVALALPHTSPRALTAAQSLSRFLTAVYTVPFPALSHPLRAPRSPLLGGLPRHAPPLTAPHTHSHGTYAAGLVPLRCSCGPSPSFSQVLSPCPPLTLTKLFPAHASRLRAAQLHCGTACPLGSSTTRRPRPWGCLSRDAPQAAPTRGPHSGHAHSPALPFTRLTPVLAPDSSQRSPSLLLPLTHPAACSPLTGPAQLRAGLLWPGLPRPPPSPPKAETFPQKRGSAAYLVGPRILQKQKQSLRTELWAWGGGPSSAHTPRHPTAARHDRRPLLCPQPSEQDGAESESTPPHILHQAEPSLEGLSSSCWAAWGAPRVTAPRAQGHPQGP